MRVVYPTVTENGFGNNVITLAKAHLISRSCSLAYQSPVWPYCMHVKPASANGYGYYFPSSRADRIRVAAYSLLVRAGGRLRTSFPFPALTFTRDAYERSGVEDAGEACQAFLHELGLESGSLVLTVGGMWGGYAAIRRAREWITDLMLGHELTRRSFEAHQRRVAGRLRVAINIRMNDFVAREAAGPIAPGERVVRLPLRWYIELCRKIREHADCAFILVSDGRPDELEEFISAVNPLHILGEPYQDLLGVLLLSGSDLIIASNSTYSRLGAFLNDRPYIWPAECLYPDDTGGFGYLWKDRGHPPQDRTLDYWAVKRCFALSVGATELPPGLVRYLQSEGTAPIEDPTDLLYRDGVPTYQGTRSA